MPTYEEERRKNLDAYDRLKNEIRSKHQGQYIAIADGRLIKVAPNFEEADQAVNTYRHRFVFPAGEEPEIGPLRVRSPQWMDSLADSIRIRRNDLNEYRVQITVGDHLVDAIRDTGMSSPDCLIGVGLDRERFAAARSGLRRLRRIGVEGVGSIRPTLVFAGLGTVAINGLDGNEMETYVAEVGDNLLGVCYFHRLAGYEVIWVPDAAEMTIRKKPPLA